MKTKTRYYIRYNAKPIGFNFEDYNTLKDLETGIKKFIDNKITFEVWVKFEFDKNPDTPYGFDNYTSFGVWYYDAETDGVSNFNLRKNRYYKTLRRYERRLSKLMKTYNFNKSR